MEDHKEKRTPWLSVPQFGDWDQTGPLPDYSLNFSKIRENRKQNKRDPSRVSLGHEQEFIKPKPAADPKPVHTDYQHHYRHQDYHPTRHSPPARRSLLSYFACCGKA